MSSRAGRRSAPTPIKKPESAEAAYGEALKRLARQPQSRAALGQRLRQLGYTGEAVSAALDRAVEHGYLNEREYAESLVRRRRATRGHALIARELYNKGIEEGAATAALAEVEPETEMASAVALGRRLLTQKRPADPDALAAYLAPRLARRGFGGGLVYRVCRLLGDEWEAAGRFDSV